MHADLVDAHVHFWRRADLPWRNGPMVPRIFGDYEALRRDYPVGEYAADAVPAGVRAAVYVQANWPAERAVEEVEWLASLHEETAQAEENDRVEQERYRQGVALSSESLDAQTLVVNARLREDGALFDCLVAKASLERAVGE